MIVNSYSYYVAVIPAKKKTTMRKNYEYRKKKRNYILG